MSIEQTILKNLTKNEEYSRKVLPFLKSEYFSDNAERQVFIQINDHVLKYNTLPSKESLGVMLENQVKGITDSELEKCEKIINSFDSVENTDLDWLVDNTEKFCQDRAIFNAMTVALDIMGNKNNKMSKGAIPQLLSDALSISFDPHVGHDYFAQSDERFDFYHAVEEKLPFDLKFLNLVTKNGLSKKTLNVILGGINVGKTLIMCHMAASYLNRGYNVLYITLEMSEQRIAERIDANLLNVSLDDIETISKDTYKKKMQILRSKTNGNLIIQEYPTASASTLHFKLLLNELAIKKNFKPNVIFIDYINICASSRFKPGQGGMYDYIKSIAEEIRGLAIENDLPIVTATQVNRTGFTHSDPGLEHTAESFGLPAAADFMFSVVTNEDLDKLGQYMFTQLKSRYSDKNKNKRFIVGVDKSKMRLYDVESSAQNIVQSGQTKPLTKTNKPGTIKEKFAGLKV